MWWHVLSRTHNLSPYWCGCRYHAIFVHRNEGEKRTEGGKVRGGMVKDSALNRLVVLAITLLSLLPLSAFYLFTRASISVFLPLYRTLVLRIFFSPAFHQAPTRSRTSPPFSSTRRKRRLSRRLSLVERRVHTFVVVSNTRKAIFSQSRICDILRRFYVLLR